MTLIVIVDDMIITRDNPKEISRLQEQLAAESIRNIKTLEIEVARSKQSIYSFFFDRKNKVYFFCNENIL